MRDVMNIYLFVYILSIVVCEQIEKAKEGVLWEYCPSEVFFSPQCKPNEVIIMESARYGHIQLGRCIDTDFGHLGCALDQLSWIDTICSGKESCDVEISDNGMKGPLPCTAALARYLEAKYRCQKVYNVEMKTCTEETNIPVKSRTQYLASETTKSTSCGIETKPWVLEAKAGQQINMSLTDFNWRKDKSVIVSHPCPVRYGYIIDNELNQAIDICGGTKKHKHLHLSKGRSVRIIIDASRLDDVSFLINFQTIGCPTYVNSPETWAKQDNDVITVGCNHNTKTWKMRCLGNNWIGLATNCEKAVDKELYLMSSDKNEKQLFGMPKVIMFTVIGGVFLIIICVTVTIIIGIFCIQKKNTEEKSNGYFMTPLTYPTLQMNNTLRGYPPENSQTLLSRSMDPYNHIANGENNLSPQYFVLESEDKIAEGVYQNVS